MTLAQKFKQEAHRIMPHQSDLLELDDRVNTASEIDEIMFHKSEYIGGMAAVILEIIK